MNIKTLKRKTSLSHRLNLRRKAHIFLLSFFIIVWATIPSVSQAGGWKGCGALDFTCKEDNYSIPDTIAKIQDLLDAMEKGEDALRDVDINQMIEDMKKIIETSKISPGDLKRFKNEHCESFKTNLAALLDNFQEIGNELSSLQDPDVFTLSTMKYTEMISKIPCTLIAPFWVLDSQINLLDGPMASKLSEFPEHIETVRDFMNAQINETPDGDISRSATCSVYKGSEVPINLSITAFKSLAIITKITGAILNAVGTTALAGPKEVKVAVWGWVGTKIAQDTWGTFGTITSGVGGALLSIGSSLTATKNACIIREEHIVLQGQHDDLTSEHNDLMSQHDDLKRQHNDLKEQNASLMSGQEEIIQLLLTPQGKRETDFCHPDFNVPCKGKAWNKNK